MFSARHIRFLGLALAVAILIAPVPAQADITFFDADWVLSSTNPGARDDHATVWREGWGNDPLAKFVVKVPQPMADVQPAIVGGLYLLQRPGISVVDTITPAMWPDLYSSPVVNASTWRFAVDIIGEDANPGPYFGSTAMVPGATRTYEGPFVASVRMYADGETNAAFGQFIFGLDVTPPAKVTGLRAVPGYGDAPVNGYLKQSRVHLFWDDKRYDTLAGTGYFEVFIDGKPFMVDEESLKIYDLKEHFWADRIAVNTPREATLEELPAGKHTLQVRAVDRATNPGPLSDPLTFSVDPDIPEIGITWPSINGQVIGVKPTFKATVKDLGGVASVKFYVDGIYRATDTESPYQATVDLSGYANGSSHVVRVIAEDMAGRTNFAEQSFVIDKAVPVLTLTSAGPSVFYPRKRDGYRDNYTVKFRSNEPVKAHLTIKDSSGNTWRTMSKSMPAGSSQFVWNGRSNADTMKRGTFRWYLKLVDNAGNTSSVRSGTATIKYYQVIRTGTNAVRIVER